MHQLQRDRKDVFENLTVAPALASDFTTLRADLTNWSSPAQQKHYGFDRLPTIVILNPNGTEIKALRITGRLPVADFQKRLKAAKDQSHSSKTPAAQVAQR